MAYIKQQDDTVMVANTQLDSTWVEVTTLPEDRVFRDAWTIDGSNVTTDLPKAKEIAHGKRRAERSELFAPLDVEATIPSMANAAEQVRQVIRDVDAIKQLAIDSAVDEEELRGLL